MIARPLKASSPRHLVVARLPSAVSVAGTAAVAVNRLAV